MKIEKKERAKKVRESTGVVNPNMYAKSHKVGFIILLVIAILGILLVVNIGKKAEKTVKVVMTSQSIHKNQSIVEDMLRPYDMVQAEYEKYTVVDGSGQVKERRLVLWDEREEIINAYAAYPIAAETTLMYSSLVASRVDNSDTVLYSFPGKDIVQLTIGATDLNAFKTFLQPGDKLNIESTFSEEIEVDESDGVGGTVKKKQQVFKTDTVFGNIMIADLINSNGDSILDIYSDYNEMSIWQQAQLDGSSTFKESVEPASLIVALTPSEKKRYYKFLAKDNVTFRVSLPQRTQ